MLINFYTNNASTSQARYLYIANDLGTIKRRLILVSSKTITSFNVGPLNALEDLFTTVAGSGSLFDSEASFYRVSITNSSGFNTSKSLAIYLDNNCYKHDPVNLVFLDRLGSFGGFGFNYRSTETQNIKRETARYTTGDLQSDGKWGFSSPEYGENTLSIEKTDSIELVTAWLNDEQSAYFQELISSPLVYWQDPNNLYRQYPVIVETSSSVKQKKANNKNIRYTINIRFANRNPINW